MVHLRSFWRGGLALPKPLAVGRPGPLACISAVSKSGPVSMFFSVLVVLSGLSLAVAWQLCCHMAVGSSRHRQEALARCDPVQIVIFSLRS